MWQTHTFSISPFPSGLFLSVLHLSSSPGPLFSPRGAQKVAWPERQSNFDGKQGVRESVCALWFKSECVFACLNLHVSESSKKRGLKALTVVKPISLVKQLSAGQLNKSSWTVKWSEVKHSPGGTSSYLQTGRENLPNVIGCNCPKTSRIYTTFV